MKKTLLLIPILLVSCSGKEQRFENVSYIFNIEHKVYNVLVNENYYHVKLDNVYHVYSNEYFFTTNGDSVLTNEFYVKGQSYKLYLYHKQ